MLILGIRSKMSVDSNRVSKVYLTPSDKRLDLIMRFAAEKFAMVVSNQSFEVGNSEF